MSVAATIGAITSAAASQAGTIIDVWNTVLQQDKLNYDKNAQQTTWNREDNAVQRRADDLEAAGLSKTLAAGSAAQASAPIRTEAPQMKTDNLVSQGQAVQNLLALQSQKAQIDKTQEENKLIRLQQERQALENSFMSASNPQTLRLKEQELSFNEAANPRKLLQMDEANKGLNLDNRLKTLDGQLKTLGIDQAQINLIKTKLDNDFQRLNIHGKSQDIIAKELAIKMAEIDLDNSAYDTQWYHNQSVPKNFNFGLLQGPFGTASALTNALNKILKGGN